MLINDARIRNTKPAGKPQKLFDGGGLFLLLQPNGSRWWRLKYRFDGREKTLSLGVYPEVSLKQARERREALRRTIADGVDPSAIRKSEKRARTNTFEAVAREWYEQRVPNWTQEYAKLLLRRLERNLFPWIGSKPVAKLTAADVLDCLQRIQKRGALETAHRARGTCGEVMRYAVATRRAERDPVADLRGALPPTKPTHFASIKDPVKVGELMRAIAGYDAKAEAVRAALRLAPYVFVRPTPILRSPSGRSRRRKSAKPCNADKPLSGAPSRTTCLAERCGGAGSIDRQLWGMKLHERPCEAFAIENAGNNGERASLGRRSPRNGLSPSGACGPRSM
jgi:hypothetical protein